MTRREESPLLRRVRIFRFYSRLSGCGGLAWRGLYVGGYVDRTCGFGLGDAVCGAGREARWQRYPVRVEPEDGEDECAADLDRRGVCRRLQ